MSLLVQDVMNLAIPFSLLATMRFIKTKGLSSPPSSSSSSSSEREKKRETETERKGLKGKGEKKEPKKAKGGHTEGAGSSAGACLFCSDS